jgi:hypothetical protein
MCKKRVAVQNKSNSFLKIFWNLHEHYNYLQITQIGIFLEKLLKVSDNALVQLWIFAPMKHSLP